MGALTDTGIRHLKPRAKPYQVADGEGLVLEVRPSGQKSWLYRYRLYGRAEKASLGSYPDIKLAKAREVHGDAKKLVAGKKSPAQQKQDEKRRLSDDLRTVSGLAKAYLTDYVDTLVSAKRGHYYIEKKILPAIGRKFLDEVTPADCIGIVESIDGSSGRSQPPRRQCQRVLRKTLRSAESLRRPLEPLCSREETSDAEPRH